MDNCTQPQQLIKLNQHGSKSFPASDQILQNNKQTIRNQSPLQPNRGIVLIHIQVQNEEQYSIVQDEILQTPCKQQETEIASASEF